MSDEKEKLKYKIKKLHRKKLHEKLDEIQKQLSESQLTQQKIATKRRRENIYVLFALAIIGGFLSITPGNSVVIDPLFITTFGIFALASSIFIIIKINTVALSDISFIQKNEKNIDDYADYLFIFSINGIFLLIIVATTVDTLDIEISEVQPSVFFIAITLISATLSLVVSYYQSVRRQKYGIPAETVKTHEEVKEKLTDKIISEVNDLRKTNSMQEELNEFTDLAYYIQQSRVKFTSPEDFDPIFEEIENLESVSDELEDSIRQSFTEARDFVRDKVMEEASLDEKQQRFEEKYEDIAFDDGTQ